MNVEPKHEWLAMFQVHAGMNMPEIGRCIGILMTMINAPYPLSKELTNLVKDVPSAASPQPDREEQSRHGLFFVAPDGTIIAEVEDVLEGGWTHLRTPIKGYDVVSYRNGKPIPNDGPLTPDQPSKIIPV